jgi:hypothetical protein
MLEEQPRDGGKAGPMRKILALTVIISGVFFAAVLFASQPVRVIINGCVRGGELLSQKTGLELMQSRANTASGPSPRKAPLST